LRLLYLWNTCSGNKEKNKGIARVSKKTYLLTTHLCFFNIYVKREVCFNNEAICRTIFTTLVSKKKAKTIPRIIGQKVKYSNISKEDRSPDIKAALMLLAKARVCNPVYHSSCSGLPLHAGYDPHTYKLLFLDIGLVNFMCGTDWHTISSLNNQRLINEGALAEQFIGQHLLYLNNGKSEPAVHYWIREGKSSNAGVDFVISRGTWIIPVEVKAGKSGSLKSIQQFIIQKNKRFALRFDCNKPGMQEIEHVTRVGMTNRKACYRLLSLPLYLVEQARGIIDMIRFNTFPG
jgi:hypothetical protein